MIHIDGNLYYRRIEREDLPFRVEWINDPLINKTLTFDVPVSLASTDAWFNRVAVDNSKLNLTFFYKHRSSFIPIGFGGFINIDNKHRKAELFITIGDKSFHGKGLAKPLVNFLCDFGFKTLGLHKVYLSTLSHNERAENLYRSCGFVHEGTFKDHIFHRGSYRSLIFMARFKSSI